LARITGGGGKEMKRSAEKILTDVLELMDSFKYEQNEDRPSNSFFEAELNEDGFFILRNEIESFIKCAKSTEQQLQPGNAEKPDTETYRRQEDRE
jgi:hypothetical protein